MNGPNLQCEVKGYPAGALSAHHLVALAVTSVAVMATASALNAIATSKSETVPRRSDLTHRSAANFHYGIAHVSMPKGKKTFPPELLPEP